METAEINKILYEFMGMEWIVFAACQNCGADNGLHHYETEQCPKNGVEEWRSDRPQLWQESTWEPQTNPDYTSEESPRRLLAEVEAKFIEAFEAGQYFDRVYIACNFSTLDALTASALTRSTAMAEYLKEKK